jgi:hypothetical protein
VVTGATDVKFKLLPVSSAKADAKFYSLLATSPAAWCPRPFRGQGILYPKQSLIVNVDADVELRLSEKGFRRVSRFCECEHKVVLQDACIMLCPRYSAPALRFDRLIEWRIDWIRCTD